MSCLYYFTWFVKPHFINQQKNSYFKKGTTLKKMLEIDTWLLIISIFYHKPCKTTFSTYLIEIKYLRN